MHPQPVTGCGCFMKYNKSPSVRRHLFRCPPPPQRERADQRWEVSIRLNANLHFHFTIKLYMANVKLCAITHTFQQQHIQTKPQQKFRLKLGQNHSKFRNINQFYKKSKKKFGSLFIFLYICHRRFSDILHLFPIKYPYFYDNT